MAKPHKLANARIEVDTALPVQRAIDVARQAVGTQRALKITGEADGVLRVQVNQGIISAPVMTFFVKAEADGTRTRVVSAIDEYRTSQTTVYFVPVTSKSMEGMGVYRRFMVSFGQAMQAADPSAHVQMIERDLPAGAAPTAPRTAAPAQAAPPVPLPAAAPEAVPLPVAAPSAEPTATAAEVPAVHPAAQPAFAPAAQAAPAPVPQFAPATPLLSETNARIVQIVGGVILVIGLIIWYATPSNVTVGPLLVMLLGAVVAGVGFIIGRNAGRAAADELAAKLRNERAMAGMVPDAAAAPPVQAAPTVPMPPAEPMTAAVPMPPAEPVVPLPPVESAVPAVHALPTVPAVPTVPAAPAAPAVPAVPAVPAAPAVSTIPPVPLPPSTMPAPDASPTASASAGPISSIPGMAPTQAPTPASTLAPAPASTPSPSLSPAPAPVPAPAVDDLDATRIAPIQAQVEWRIVLADGRALAVASALRIGRDPIADPAMPGTVLVPIVDPAKSLSKTHAQLEASPGLVVVTDLHSTNGTKVRTVDGGEIVLAPEAGHRITGDAEISFGDYVVRLQRQAGS